MIACAWLAGDASVGLSDWMSAMSDAGASLAAGSMASSWHEHAQRNGIGDGIGDGLAPMDEEAEEDPMDDVEREDARLRALQQRLLSAGQPDGPGTYIESSGLSGSWQVWTEELEGKIFPARILCTNLNLRYLQQDAENLCEALTPEDPEEAAHAKGQFTMLALMSTGTGKGFHTGTPPWMTEMRDNGADEDDIAKEVEKRMKHPVKGYTYIPGADTQDRTDNDMRPARQFVWFLEYIRNEDGDGYMGLRVWKVIFDKTHSDTSLLNNLMNENENARNQTTNHAMADALRKPNDAAIAKSARQMDSKDLERSVPNQHRWVKNNRDLLKAANLYTANGLARLYPNIEQEAMQAGTEQPLFPHQEFGGTHPLSPEMMFNARRHRPLSAGWIAKKTDSVRPAAAQIDPTGYDPPDRSLRFDPEATRRGDVLMTTHSSIKTLLDHVELPKKVAGQVRPEPSLLRSYFSQMHTKDPALVALGLKDAVIDRGADAVFDEYKEQLSRISEDGIGRIMGTEKTGAERLLNGTQLASFSSIDLSPAERVRLQEEARGKKSDGARPREALAEVGTQLNNLISFLDSNSRRQHDAIRTRRPPEGADEDELERWRTNNVIDNDNLCRETSENYQAAIRFGLKLHARCFKSRRDRMDIPPGVLESHDALMSDLKALGKVINEGKGVYNLRVADVGTGTANIAFGTDKDQYCDASDGDSKEATKTPWAVWREFLNNLFTRVLKIDGRELRICMEIYQQLFETLADFSTVLVLCGAAGVGKSERPKRMSDILPKGSVQKSGSRSAKEGMNPGWTSYCSKLCLYDEAPAILCDKAQEDYAKQVLSDNCVQHARSAKTVNGDGFEDWGNRAFYVYHYESDVVSNNEGPMLNRDGEEPSTSKNALYQRSHTQVVFTAKTTDAEAHTNDNEYKRSLEDPNNASAIVSFKVMVGIIKKLLSFTQKVTKLGTNTKHANVLFRLFDQMLLHEFGIARPDSRKEKKRHWTLTFITAEAACAEVFFTKQSASLFDFMLPEVLVDADQPTPEDGIRGYVRPWDELHLEPVARRATMPTPHEIIAAWSAGLDYSEQTSAHFWWVQYLMAQSVGINPDLRDLMSWNLANEPPAAPTPTAGDVPGPSDHQAAMQNVESDDEDPNREDQRAQVDPSDVVPGRQPRDKPSQRQDGGWQTEPAVPVAQEFGVRFPSFLSSEKRKVTLKDMQSRGVKLEKQRMAHVRSLRMGQRGGSCDGGSAIQNIKQQWDNEDRAEWPMILDGGVVVRMDRQQLEGFAFPSPSDMLLTGYKDQDLIDFSKGEGFDDVLGHDYRFGTSYGSGANTWTFHLLQPNNKTPTAAAFDPSWRVLGTAAEPPDSAKRWQDAACKLRTNCPSVCDKFGLTTNIVKDCIFRVSQWSVAYREPKYEEQMTKYETCMTVVATTDQNHEGDPALAQAPDIGTKMRPSGAFAFRGDSKVKRRQFGKMFKRHHFSELWMGHEPGVQYGTTFANRLEALVDNGHLPAMAPLCSTRVSEGAPVRLLQDNRLIFSTDYLVGFANLFTEVALKNYLHPSMRGNPYSFQLGRDTPGTGSVRNAVEDRSKAAKRVQREQPIPQTETSEVAVVDGLPLTYDMLQIFLTTKAVEKMSWDTGDFMQRLGMDPDDVVPRFCTRFPTTTGVNSNTAGKLLTIQWKTQGTGETDMVTYSDPTPEELKEAKEKAQAQQARTVADNDPIIAEFLFEKAQKLSPLPHDGNHASFSNWIENCYLLGQDEMLFADSCDPVFRLLQEVTLGCRSAEIRKGMAKDGAWRAVFQIAGNDSSEDPENVANVRQRRQEAKRMAEKRAEQAAIQPAAFQVPSRKRAREEEVGEEGGEEGGVEEEA